MNERPWVAVVRHLWTTAAIGRTGTVRVRLTDTVYACVRSRQSLSHSDGLCSDEFERLIDPWFGVLPEHRAIGLPRAGNRGAVVACGPSDCSAHV